MSEIVVSRSRVIPIATIDRLQDAAPLGRAILDGGLSSIEVTLRTPVALEAIATIVAEVPQLNVGAGTVGNSDQVEAARLAGAAFLVSPAQTAALLTELEACGLPFLCGAATASDVAQLLERGVRAMKLFPAEAIGGTSLLRAFGAVFPEASFCPTGGIGRENAAEYLALTNVFAVGSSWIAERDPREPDWEAVAAAARVAARLSGEAG